jgi:hypothetical protein
MASSVTGLVGLGLAFLTLHLTAVALGSATALLLALAVSMTWGLLVILAKRSGLPI